jgi:hypothetical protein
LKKLAQEEILKSLLQGLSAILMSQRLQERKVTSSFTQAREDLAYPYTQSSLHQKCLSFSK